MQKFIDNVHGFRSRPARLNATEAYTQMLAAIEATACAIRDTEALTSSCLLEEYEEVPPRMSIYVYGCSPYSLLCTRDGHQFSC